MMSSMTVFHKTEMYEDFQRQTDRISEEDLNIRCKHDQSAIHMRTKTFRNEFSFSRGTARSSIVDRYLRRHSGYGRSRLPAQTAQPGINH